MIKATKPSGELTKNPKEYLLHQNKSIVLSVKHDLKKIGKRKKNKTRDKVEYGSVSTLFFWVVIFVM